MFDVREYLLVKHNGHRSKQLSSADEIALPNCPFCNKDRDHFNFHIKKKRGGCLKCGRGVESVAGLVAVLENISIDEATKIVAQGDGDKIDGIINTLTSELIEEEEFVARHVNADPPPEFELMVDVLRTPTYIIPKYFSQRKYPYSIISRYNIGFCRTGDYAARIIFPFRTELMRSFVARRIHDWMSKKYKNPPNSKHSQLLYGYEFIKQDSIIFVTEGPTDVLRIAEYGGDAVCTFGKKISMEQINLLFDLKPKEIVNLFDGDAFTENMRAYEKVALRLKTSYIALPKDSDGEYFDPDELSKEMFIDLFNRRANMSKIENTINILQDIV